MGIRIVVLDALVEEMVENILPHCVSGFIEGVLNLIVVVI